LTVVRRATGIITDRGAAEGTTDDTARREAGIVTSLIGLGSLAAGFSRRSVDR